jgi:hypothetical protein
MRTFLHKEDGEMVEVIITATFYTEGGYTLVECKTLDGECFSTTKMDIYYQEEKPTTT